MTEIQRPINNHAAYHAHVYFDESSAAFAIELCEQISRRFGLVVGRVHQKCVGPHTRWSCQISFAQNHFDDFIPWLDGHRKGLTVFVHGLSSDNLKDHTDYAYWLGDAVEINVSQFLSREETI